MTGSHWYESQLVHQHLGGGSEALTSSSTQSCLSLVCKWSSQRAHTKQIHETIDREYNYSKQNGYLNFIIYSDKPKVDLKFNMSKVSVPNSGSI